jgi:hypothetical protein
VKKIGRKLNLVNKQKIKGTNWEKDFIALLEKAIPESKGKRIAGSGSLGTVLNEPLLSGDVVIFFPGFSKKFRGECKIGYGGEKQMTIKKEWFDKIKTEAQNAYCIPLVALKFSGARRIDGIQYVIAFDFDSFVELINYVNELKKELDLKYK